MSKTIYMLFCIFLDVYLFGMTESPLGNLTLPTVNVNPLLSFF